jgi:hypothetical protein
MRAFLIFAIIAGLGFLYLRQRQNETPPATGNSVATQPAKPAVVAALTPAPRGVASEHNWMKRSLDRARDVTEQSRDRTQEAQRP